jgi:hypothetical protein
VKAKEIIEYLYDENPTLRDAVLSEAIARAEAAEAALAERDKPCAWKVDAAGWWITGCGQLAGIDAIETQGKYCPACGHPIEVQP